MLLFVSDVCFVQDPVVAVAADPWEENLRLTLRGLATIRSTGERRRNADDVPT